MAPVDKAATFFTCFAALLWGIVTFAGVAMGLGESDAINAVVGAGVPAVFVTTAAVSLHIQDRSRPKQTEGDPCSS